MPFLTDLRNRFDDICMERFVGVKRLETFYVELEIPNPVGPPIYAHLHRPLASTADAGVVMVPGGVNAGTVFDHSLGVTALDVASMGFSVLHYDPSGRGKTGGCEDHWGPIHQKELAAVIKCFSMLPGVKEDNISIFSFSIGICIAAGALSRYPLPGIRLLFDWEGPSNRFNITRNDTHPPLRQKPCCDVSFWREREPSRSIGLIACGYFRYQGQRDHMQGRYKGHAIELVNLATQGRARWTRLNGNLPNTFLNENKINQYDWVPAHQNHKWQVLKYFLDAQRLAEK